MGSLCESLAARRPGSCAWGAIGEGSRGRSPGSPRDLASLEERSRWPHRTRRPTWGNELALAVQELREQYPWGKDKLAVLLREQGWACSVSMVGRILSSLQRRGVVGKVSLKDPWQRSRPLRG